MKSYSRQFVEPYSILATPLTDILQNEDFASTRARRYPIPWAEQQQRAFLGLNSDLTSFRIFAFPAWDSPFV